MNNIEIGSKVKVKEPKNNPRWTYLCCPSELDGEAIEDLEFTVLEEDESDFFLRLGEGNYCREFYFPKETVYLVDAELNPFTQDSLQIGTVVEWEGKRIKVARWGNCDNCIFFEAGCIADMKVVNCTSSSNTDCINRKYILINEQQEEEIMSIKLEDGKKYVTEGGEVVTVSLVGELASGHPYGGSNGFSYTIDGKLYSNGAYSPNNIVSEYIEEIKQEPEGHVHAELMLEYGKLALTTKEPWLEYESQLKHPEAVVWHQCNSQLLFAPDTRYRRKPKTILINGYEVPEPLRVAPEEGTFVFAVSLLDKIPTFKFVYTSSCVTHVRMLNRELLHLTQEAAQLHAKALLSFTTTVQEKQDEEV